MIYATYKTSRGVGGGGVNLFREITGYIIFETKL